MMTFHLLSAYRWRDHDMDTGIIDRSVIPVKDCCSTCQLLLNSLYGKRVQSDAVLKK